MAGIPEYDIFKDDLSTFDGRGSAFIEQAKRGRERN